MQSLDRQAVHRSMSQLTGHEMREANTLNPFNTSELLTNREREIAELVSLGLSAKEAALELGIAPCTVDRHVENIRLKTRTRNRVHMIAHLIRTGLLHGGSPRFAA